MFGEFPDLLHYKRIQLINTCIYNNWEKPCNIRSDVISNIRKVASSDDHRPDPGIIAKRCGMSRVSSLGPPLLMASVLKKMLLIFNVWDV